MDFDTIETAAFNAAAARTAAIVNGFRREGRDIGHRTNTRNHGDAARTRAMRAARKAAAAVRVAIIF